MQMKVELRTRRLVTLKKCKVSLYVIYLNTSNIFSEWVILVTVRLPQSSRVKWALSLFAPLIKNFTFLTMSFSVQWKGIRSLWCSSRLLSIV